MKTVGALRVHMHGSRGAAVVVLHGGPAAVGSAAGLAAGLSDRFQVFEPWQRGSGAEPLAVARHVADLHGLVSDLPAPLAIVGESWGAMLALAYAAAHPDHVAAMALVGCGTFDRAARAKLAEALASRRADSRPYDFAAMSPRYEDRPPEPFDADAHAQTWNDMLRLQAEGVYPQAFAAIRSPVLMIYGDHDPHPGAMIRDSLKPYIPQLEYQELKDCGHSPWIERFAHEAFFATLKTWLASVMAAGP